MIWPWSSCAFDFHLQSTVMISIVTGMTPWSPSFDLNQRVVTWSSHKLLLLQLLLSHSDKVKQLFGTCILCNKETTIEFLPVADNFNKTWSSHTTTYISSCLDHITSQHALQKQVRRPLLCCCKFYMDATGWARTVLTYASKTTTIVRQVSAVLTFSRTRRSHSRFN